MIPWREAVMDALWRMHLRQGRLRIARGDFIRDELDAVVAVTEAQGATPEQTLSLVLQELRDVGYLDFAEHGTYLLRPPLLARFASPLLLHRQYTRAEAHAILAPSAPFESQRAQWGLQGLIPLPGRPGDFVFFVSFGQTQGEHQFDEGITEDGVLTWQSQPRQGFNSAQIRQLIAHDDLRSTIHLFLRTQRRGPYAYLGRLRYVEHDPDREHPVYFHWQLIEGAPPQEVRDKIGLVLQDSYRRESASAVRGLEEVPPPTRRPRRLRARVFRARRVPNRLDEEARSRELGRAGELLVLQHERERLRAMGRADLAERVRDVAGTEGDGAGYDIQSFDLNGTERYLEVKTTRGPEGTPFMISAHEVAFSQEHPDEFELVRVFDCNPERGSGRVYRRLGAVPDHFALDPTEFRASP